MKISFYSRQKPQLPKILGVTILCLTLLFVSGCQTNPNSNTATNNDITKITFWHGINPPENRDIFKELLAKFQQNNPDIQVEELYIGQPDAQLPKIISSVVGNQPPDVLWYVPQLTGKLRELNAIEPLQDWLDNSPIKAQIDPAMLSTMELDGKIWSVPFATNNAAMFYRPSLFEKAGITEPPKTWNEFKEVAAKLTQDFDGDGRIDQNGVLLASGTGEFTVFVWLPFIFSAGGAIVQDNKPGLVNAGTEKALKLGADLVKDGVAILSAPNRGYELDNFISGKVAMQITGPWTLAQLKQTGIDYSAFPLPIIDQPAAVLGGESLFVFKTTPEREEAALRFLEYILGEEFQTAWALKTGYIPINTKAQQSEKYQAFVRENPVLEVFLAQMQWAKSRPIIAAYPTISENLGRAVEASLLGEKSPREALKQAQQRIELSSGKN